MEKEFLWVHFDRRRVCNRTVW